MQTQRLLVLYNYITQKGLQLSDILYEEDFTRAEIRNFSPGRMYMYFFIRQNYTNIQPEKGGMYEYNLFGEYFRHIAKDDLSFILWDMNSGSNVLLKDRDDNKDKYYIHPVESFDIYPVDSPEKIVEFIN